MGGGGESAHLSRPWPPPKVSGVLGPPHCVSGTRTLDALTVLLGPGPSGRPSPRDGAQPTPAGCNPELGRAREGAPALGWLQGGRDCGEAGTRCSVHPSLPSLPPRSGQTAWLSGSEGWQWGWRAPFWARCGFTFLIAVRPPDPISLTAPRCHLSVLPPTEVAGEGQPQPHPCPLCATGTLSAGTKVWGPEPPR